MDKKIIIKKTEVKHIVISGTNAWNPGDDFVRDGVIAILKKLFEGYRLNFLFYNFNQDFFPQSKFTGIANIVSKGDLNSYRDFIDAIVIAGLSAGFEIKDLYNWIIENNLHDRVYLIGAGYENSYVDKYIYEEPEATIFRNAKIITGRTKKTPEFIPKLNLPYHHINCPAILSVKDVKYIPPGKKIKKIGFSIQLPHETGVLNHCCAEKMYKLSVEILKELKDKYDIDIIGHHKTEYFHFLNLFDGTVPVIFSSYYQDLFDIYPKYDLFITTRLHSSLFANGHGIPGIILNDTDRHTHCLEGFPHSVWVDNKDKFYREFNRLCKTDLCQIAEEAKKFKDNLMKKYIEILEQPFGLELHTDKPINFVEKYKKTLPEEHIIPVHFFTIVLNGQPFIRYHIEVFKQLSFDWHWHIIEGVADLKHDTAWSLQSGGHITDELHKKGLSNDGTSEYLNRLAEEFPHNITIYRKNEGAFWDGKLEMVNAPLVNIKKECLLWQIDADELWTVEQVCSVVEMFVKEPDKTSAYYLCHYFVGPELVITSRNTYGNHLDYEWLRTWRFRPGDRWLSHEPPKLCRQDISGQWIDLGKLNSFIHKDTEPKNLIFQHYAYVLKEQLRFKELYYGYKNAVKKWKKLQKQSKFPVFLRDYFPWVADNAIVDSLQSQHIAPVAQKDISGQWSFKQKGLAPDKILNILWIRTDSIGDNILSSSMLPYIREKYKNAKITVVCQEHIMELYTACPFVDDIITFNRRHLCQDEQYRNNLILKLRSINANLSLNSVYSRELITDVLSIDCNAKEKIALYGDLSNMSKEIHDRYNQFYTKLLQSPGKYKTEIERHMDFLRGLGIYKINIQPVIWTTSEDDRFALNFIKSNNLEKEKIIALFPGGQHYHKIYPEYQGVLKDFKNFVVIILGNSEDMERAKNIENNFQGKCFNLAGKTTIRQMAGIMRKCHLYIGTDSAGAHVACAVGITNIVILGGGHFGRFFPYSPLTSIVCLPLECYDCNWACKYERPHCVQNIMPEVFSEAIKQTLEHTSHKPRIFVQNSSLWNQKRGQPEWQFFDKYLNVNEVQIIMVDEISTAISEINEAIFLINQLREMDLWEEAYSTLTAIIIKYPFSPDLLNIEAELKCQMGQIEEAKSLLFNLVEKFPENSKILNNTGAILWSERNAEEALPYLMRSLKVDPDNRLANLNLADILVSLGKYEEAINLFSSYLERNPRDEEIKGFLEIVKAKIITQEYENNILEGISEINELRGMELLEEASASLADLISIYPDTPELLILEGELNFQMGNVEEAKNKFLGLSQKFPGYSQIFSNIGVVYLNEGNLEKALYYYNKSLEINPDDMVATLNLADLLVTLNKCEEAEKLLSSYLNKYPDVEEISFVLEGVKERLSSRDIHTVLTEGLKEVRQLVNEGELEIARFAVKGLLFKNPYNQELLELQEELK